MQETLDNCSKCSMCHGLTEGEEKDKWISSFFKLRNIWSHNDWEFLQISCCQSLSHVWFYVNPLTAACQVPLFFTISRVCSNSCPLSWWCQLTISSSAWPFSFCLQSFPASGSFSTSWLFAIGGQSKEASASASVSSSKVVLDIKPQTQEALTVHTR